MNKNILLVGLAVVVIIVLALLYNQLYRPAAPVSANTVTMENFAFNPSSITVKKGTTVTWTNKDSVAHQVSSDPYPSHTDLPGLFSNSLSQNQTYSFTFDKIGVFGYHCQIHPSMKGTVTVTE